MKKALLSLMLCYTFTTSFSQSPRKEVDPNQVNKGAVAIEGGFYPLGGISSKIGYGVANNVLVGIYTESIGIFNNRTEIGSFARAYMNTGKKFSVYAQGEIAASTYIKWNDETFLKLGIGPGVAWRLSNRFSLGSELMIGFGGDRKPFHTTFLVLTANFKLAKGKKQ